MEIRGSGLTVWYDAPDAPAPPAEAPANETAMLIVGMEPAHVHNTVQVLYRLNNGPQLSLRAAQKATSPAGGKQYFQAVFPYAPPGSEITYGVIARCVGKQVGVADGGPLPSSFKIQPGGAHPAAPASPSMDVPFPFHMELITRAKFKLTSEPEVIGVTPDGLHVNFLLAKGTCQGKHLQGEVSQHGGDWMTVRTDGVGIPDIYVTVVTAESSLILMKCTGKVDLGPNGYIDAIAGKFPPWAPVIIEGYFLGSEAKYAWLNRLQIVGVGFVKMKELLVEYDIYGILSILG
jgi:hypothetical protein